MLPVRPFKSEFKNIRRKGMATNGAGLALVAWFYRFSRNLTQGKFHNTPYSITAHRVLSYGNGSFFKPTLL